MSSVNKNYPRSNSTPVPTPTPTSNSIPNPNPPRYGDVPWEASTLNAELNEGIALRKSNFSLFETTHYFFKTNKI